MFEAEGLEPPKTFDDVLAAAKLFKDNPKYPELEGGYAMNMARGSAAGQQFYEWIYSAGGNLGKVTTLVLLMRMLIKRII